MQKKVFILISMLLVFLVPVSQLNITYALANSSEDEGDLSYYFIHYDGEEQEIVINENTQLLLTGWTDKSKSAINGKIVNQKDESKTINDDIVLDVTPELDEITLTENESIQYRLDDSDSFKVEEVKPQELNKQATVEAENENGTSIEKVKTIDENNTIIKQELVYYSTDDNDQKVEITKEEYETLNSAEDKQKPIEDSQSVKEPSKEKSITKEESAQALMKKSAVETPSVVYSTHVQSKGWMDSVADGDMGGTTGNNKRMEAIKIDIKNASYSGGITYSSHVQDKGWLNSVSNGDISGTTGNNKRMEAIKINLTGEMAKHYDVYYRGHVQDFGWLDWAKNGQAAGTEGLYKRMEAIEIVLVEKGKKAPGSTTKPLLTKPSVVYSTHVQSKGWMDFVADGKKGGTTGQKKRIEAIKVDLKDAPYSGGITYSAHVQDKGWMESTSNGDIAGTTGQKKRMEAVKIELTGDIAKHYDVYYRGHVQDFGWLDWAKNGQASGTQGLYKRMEAIEIVLVKKGKKAPGSTTKPLLTKPSVVYSTHVQSKGWMDFVADGKKGGTTGQKKRIEAIKIDLKDAPYSGDITYSAHVQSKGWMKSTSNGDIAGTTGQSKRMEAIKINLTGEMAKHYDVYYRGHVQDFGWLGWAKNGMNAGSEGLSKRVEAIEIKLVSKGKGESVSQGDAFRKGLVVFLDPGHGGYDSGATSGGYHEADLNLAIAKKVQSLLLKRGYTVYMSRHNNTYLSLLERSQMANDLKADIFISIHINSGPTAAYGIESYFYEYDPDYPSKINGIMHNNSQRLLKSGVLANKIQEYMINYTRAYNRGVKRNTFSVLRESAMPAVLLELGFITNPSERQNLISGSYQKKLAKAITNGVDNYSKYVK
ncbi:N-acetylmuramoyl-L-alanine amidase [Lentibacillus sp. N15]|uniref:N-acetylmuramoyl-L-alanine amidase n=1 Tax=Lentibacillus songyuanensis TaxID=3136161 RepID=UPI0031BAF1C7